MWASIATTCGPTSAPSATAEAPAQDRERMDHAIGLELDGGVDPGARRVDDPRLPRAMCAAFTRSRRVAAAAASSARVLTPSGERGSSVR